MNIRLKLKSSPPSTLFFIILTFIFIGNLMADPINTKNKSNRLGSEKSPYLLQHKDNPVNWFPWGEEAFKKARLEKKPIFLSIGYSSCYWCHVMEKECFEKDDVAEILNKYFVSIKVDREERPDVDEIYMEAVQAMTGHGGWPMSVFLTPDLQPFFGGTYFPRPQFLDALEQIKDRWADDTDKIKDSAARLTAVLAQSTPNKESINLDQEVFIKSLEQLKQSFESEYGGFGRAPKFPQSTRLDLALRIYLKTKDSDILEIYKKTLDHMARGGMYDQLAGGFHRYSTDKKWLVPHFEKMLYDNALLAKTYFEAFQALKSDEFKTIGREILDYVLSDMTSEDGAFYSAEDAGEVNKEGEFYVWTAKEISDLLNPEEEKIFRQVYSVTLDGNFEHHTNILNINLKHALADKDSDLLRSARKKLLNVRNQREHPFKDDKILTAWNGLMITAMAKGYQVTGEEKYLIAANKAATFIKKHLVKNDSLLRRYRDGEAKFNAYLEDYAYLIEGLIELYQTDFNPETIEWAIDLQKIQNELFWDKKDFGYFFSKEVDDKSLISRKKSFYDGATPSPNGISALNLQKLYLLTFNEEFNEYANNLFATTSNDLVKAPIAFASLATALDFKLGKPKEIVIVGDINSGTTKDVIKLLADNFIPNKILAVGLPLPLEDSNGLAAFRGKPLKDNKTTIYVCELGACKLPTTEPGEVLNLVRDRRK